MCGSMHCVPRCAGRCMASHDDLRSFSSGRQAAGRPAETTFHAVGPPFPSPSAHGVMPGLFDSLLKEPLRPMTGYRWIERVGSIVCFGPRPADSNPKPHWVANYCSTTLLQIFFFVPSSDYSRREQHKRRRMDSLSGHKYPSPIAPTIPCPSYPTRPMLRGLLFSKTAFLALSVPR